jgi:hypothetical protein
MLLRNDGAGLFTDAAAQMPARTVDGHAVALADVDADGDLDLGLASVPDADTAVELSVPVPNSLALHGVPLASQALFVPGSPPAAARLSNATAHSLVR